MMKDAIFLDLAMKHGITFVNGCGPVNEIEDALVIIFGRSAPPLTHQFKNNLETQPRK
jgi:hypothetical protein